MMRSNTALSLSAAGVLLLALALSPVAGLRADDASLNYRNGADNDLNSQAAVDRDAAVNDTAPRPPRSASDASEKTVLVVPVRELNSAPAAFADFFGASIAQDRQLYREALGLLDGGDAGELDALQARLQTYPLHGYLAYRRLQSNGALSAATIRRFEQEFDDARLAGKLRRQFMRQLVKQQRWAEFVEHYDTSTTNTSMRCHHAHALYRTGDGDAAEVLTRSLWLTPTSMPDACDPAFKSFTEAQQDMGDLAWQRFNGAYRAREMTLARYLSRFLDDAHKPRAEQLLDAYAKVDSLGRRWRSRIDMLESIFDDSALRRQVLALWIRRLARQDNDAAVKLLNRKFLRTNSSRLPPEQVQLLLDELRPYLLTRHALQDYNKLPTVYRKLGKPTDSKSLQWLLRAYIARGDWEKIPSLTEKLPEEERLSERWQYWRLRAQQLSGALDDAASAELRKLADQASFYGFAAAKHTKRHFRLEPERYQLVAEDLEILAGSAALRRAVEHFVQGNVTEANGNWAAGLRELDSDEWLKAAYFASRLGWHQQAILTAARADAWRHYSIRFPKVAADAFSAQALRYNQPPEWFYATARQESALASHARSHAGAIGLMQLLPSTAREVAESLGSEYSKQRLYEADYSIRLGSRYLDRMYQRFGNRALGSAAYNAGPHRVTAWLKNLQKPIPLDAWIETIRFSETRQYVQNILSFALIHTAMYPESGSAADARFQGDPAALKPWPTFSFLGDAEALVRPYDQQVEKDGAS